MDTYGRLAEPDVPTVSADVLVQYELIEECILSGQVSDAKLQDLMRSDPVLGRWLRARTTDRARTRALPAI
jgi:hypothetical protein